MAKRRSGEAEELARRVGARIRAERGSRTQAWLAGAIGVGDQSTISDYEVARTRLTLDQVVAIEDALGLARGRLLEDIYVPRERTTTETIELDPDLVDEFDRQALLMAYNIYLERKRSAD